MTECGEPHSEPSLLTDQRGMTTVEYVIALCLVGALGVGVWGKFGATVNKRVGQTSTLLRDHLRVNPGKTPLSAKGVPEFPSNIP